MALVSYSDSEGSDYENLQPTTHKATPVTGTALPSGTAFAVDKANPRKIRVHLQETKVDSATKTAEVGEPALKRQRIGTGAFSGFNSILPVPKRNAQSHKADAAAARGPQRKIFSLKTGAERGFDRASDAELRQLFAEQDATQKEQQQNSVNEDHSAAANSDSASNLTSAPNSTPASHDVGNMIMFKPLSVARKPPKRKAISTLPTTKLSQSLNTTPRDVAGDTPSSARKISLFSTGSDLSGVELSTIPTTEYQPLVYQHGTEGFGGAGPEVLDDDGQSFDDPDHVSQRTTTAPPGPQSLDEIASDLKLSAAARRQLFGRKQAASASAVNVINFNTDKEYAANEVLRASGEQVQHNPVRAPSGGKHSLKQLVSMASTQQDALEESFASGRQNKKEAGSKYGW